MSVADQLNAFIAANNGRCLDFDGFFGCQCMDLVLFWSQALGLDTIPAPSALQTWNLTPNEKHYHKVGNGPTNVPEPGDILVWGTFMGSHGHIAIFVSGDLSGFTSFDQNFPEGSDWGSPAKLVRHSYDGLLGWFHPLVEQPEPKKPGPPPPVAVEDDGISYLR